MLSARAIAVQGVGLGAAQAALQGLLGITEVAPSAPPRTGGGGSPSRRKQQLPSEQPVSLQTLRAEDEIVLSVIVAAVTKGMLR